jgi:hypothetical protein
LRQLSATISYHNQDAEPSSLFETHFPALSDDCARAIERTRPGEQASAADVRDFCLLELEKAIRRVNTRNSVADFGLPIPSADAAERLQPGNALLQAEHNYPVEEMRHTVQLAEASLTQSQRAVTEAVLDAVSDQPKVFFLQGPGGTGKTPVENYLLGFRVGLVNLCSIEIALKLCPVVYRTFAMIPVHLEV